jgi:hypothetical protein
LYIEKIWIQGILITETTGLVKHSYFTKEEFLTKRQEAIMNILLWYGRVAMSSGKGLKMLSTEAFIYLLG